ncbi:MAG: pentapeptide repeat-containing protein [Bacteroidia bacterium]
MQRFEDQTHSKVDFNQNALDMGLYEHCSFVDCTFVDADISELKFAECTFTNCDFTGARIADVAFREVKFERCKLLGLPFEDCDHFLLSLHFEECILDLVSFRDLPLKHAQFIQCSLKETDFTGADLSSATIQDCNLERAIFEHTNLEKADLRGSTNLILDPEQNRIKNAQFSLGSLPGLLKRFQIKVD